MPYETFFVLSICVIVATLFTGVCLSLSESLSLSDFPTPLVVLSVISILSFAALSVAYLSQKDTITPIHTEKEILETYTTKNSLKIHHYINEQFWKVEAPEWSISIPESQYQTEIGASRVEYWKETNTYQFLFLKDIVETEYYIVFVSE